MTVHVENIPTRRLSPFFKMTCGVGWNNVARASYYGEAAGVFLDNYIGKEFNCDCVRYRQLGSEGLTWQNISRVYAVALNETNVT